MVSILAPQLPASPRFEELLRRGLQRVRESTGVSLAFGGPVDAHGDVWLQSFAGPTLGALPGVKLTTGEGLGGRAAALQRGITVNDYVTAKGITHTYDAVIRAESLRSLVAVPLIVRRRTVGMIYGAMRGQDVIGGRIEHAISLEGRSLEQALAVQELAVSPAHAAELEVGRLREALRATHRSLVGLAATADDPSHAASLAELSARLLEVFDADDATESPARGTLTMREVDVLRLAAAGASNQGIADGLGLTLYTVKGYMKTAMAKLGGRTRFEAVVAARTAGLIP